MKLPEQRIRIVAATPIEAGKKRILPSVLVNTVSHRGDGRGLFHVVRMRPVSIVVEDAEGVKWHEIPNVTANTLSMMAVAASVIAAISIGLIAIAAIIKRD
ncbi:MAG: hypothetical protein ACP5HG_03495 [Anaerolineae bacterium]